MGLEESASGVRVHPGAAVDWELTHILWLLKAGVMIREEIVVVVKHRLVLYRLRLLELVMKVIHGWLVDSERRGEFWGIAKVCRRETRADPADGTARSLRPVQLPSGFAEW